MFQSAVALLVLSLAVPPPLILQRDDPGPMSLELDDPVGPLITDRPGFTSGTEIVSTGHFQFEVGYTFTYDSEGGSTYDHTAPQGVLRIGVSENFELRIGWDGYSFTESRSSTRINSRRVSNRDWSQGSNDLSLGFKYKIAEQDGWIPNFGVIGAISVPSGSAGQSSGDVDPSLIMLWSYDVTDSFSLGGNIGLASITSDGNRFYQTSASLAAYFALTERLGSFIEYFGYYPNAEDSDAAHTVDGGFSFLVNDNLSVDWTIGVGLNEEADDFFTTVGFSWRL